MAEKQIHKPDLSWLSPDKVDQLAKNAKALGLAARTAVPVSARPSPPPAPTARAKPVNPQGEGWLPKWQNLKFPDWFKKPEWFKKPDISIKNIKHLATIRPLWTAAACGTLAVAAGVTLVARYSSSPEELPQGIKYTQPGDAPESGTGPAYVSPSQRARTPAPAAIEQKPHQVFPPDSKSARRTPIETGLNAPELSGMASPLDGYELTEKQSRGFGVRFHPKRKRWMMHEGVDFKAPTGTPVYAISDGVIEERRWEDGYGNTIRMAHEGSINSLYAHLDKFAKGIKPGTIIKKGDVIGYVGSTGLSTGPHLHFEIHRNDKPIDPLKVAAAHAQPSNIDALIATSSAREKLNPELMPSIFAKEARNPETGKPDTLAVSDQGAAGLCQFDEQTFLIKLKKHGDRLGFAHHADQIDYRHHTDGRTYYSAGKRQDEILNLRFSPAVAIPVCAAHIKDDLNQLEAYISNRPLTIADSATSHFTGWNVAKDMIRAYDNPKFRNDPAYRYATERNYAGSRTNMAVFFKGGDPNKPYTVAEFYENKVKIVGNAPALAKDLKQAQNTPQ